MEAVDEVQGLKMSTFERDLKPNYKVFIFDYDGTLWNGTHRIPGIAQVVHELLVDPTKIVLFYTNGGYSTIKYNYDTLIKWLERELTAAQFDEVKDVCTVDKVYNTAMLAAKYIKTHGKVDKQAKVLGVGYQGMVDEIKREGFENAELLIKDNDARNAQCGITDEEFRDFPVDKSVKALIKGPTVYFDFRELTLATLYVQDPEVLFVATNEDITYCTGDSRRKMPDVGATLIAIEVATGRKATKVGKPEPFGLQIMLEDHFASERERWNDKDFLSQFLMIGDNLKTDIKFGKNTSIDTLLVLSGITTEKDIEQIKAVKPDHVMHILAHETAK